MLWPQPGLTWLGGNLAASTEYEWFVRVTDVLGGVTDGPVWRFRTRSTGNNYSPVADNKSASTTVNIPAGITLTASDANNDPLTFSLLRPPAAGILSGAAPILTYSPGPGQSGLDSFTFKANDGLTDSNEATIFITVHAVPQVEVILDNGQPGTLPSPPDRWKASSQPFPYGANSLYTTKVGATYAFKFTSLVPGDYEVSSWWTTGPLRRSDVPIDIVHVQGTKTVNVNQQQNGGFWNVLGNWSFSDKATITFRSLGTDALGSTQTCADAVKLRSITGGEGNQLPASVIDSIAPNPAMAGELISFSGHGVDPDGQSIVQYEWTSNIDGLLSSQASFSSAALSTGPHTISFRVEDPIGAWSVAAQAGLQVNPTAGPVEAILDNGQPGTSSVGTWNVSSASNAYGADSLYADKVDRSYTFQLALPQAGDYEVYLWWTQNSKRRSDVPVDVVRTGGTSTVSVNQRQNGGKWNLLGTFNFGSGATVTLRSLGGLVGENQTSADAVRLVRVGG